MVSLFGINSYLGDQYRPIIVWGGGYAGSQLISMYEVEYMNYNIVAIADNDPVKQSREIYPVRDKNISSDNIYYQRKIPVISAEMTADYCRKHPECIIVVAVLEKYRQEIFDQITELKLSNSVVYYDVFRHFAVREYIDLHIKKYDIKMAHQYFSDYYGAVNHTFVYKFRTLIGALDRNIPFITIISPPKTGGNTVRDALNEAGVSNLYFHNGYDLRENPDKPECWVPIVRKKCRKYVIGVREPVAQNISLMFNEITNIFSMREDSHNLDAQWLFDHYVAAPVLGAFAGDSIYEMELMRTGTNFIDELYIQNYFFRSIRTALGIDVFQIDFDKDKGYAITQQGENQIFLYQIEKLGGLEKELSEFVGLPSINIGRSNNSQNKFYDSVYQNFLKGFKMSREFFEYSYSCDFIKHFYSDEDIEKYKSKWIDNVV